MKDIKFFINDILKEDPFLIKQNTKNSKLINIFKLQIKLHQKNCAKYRLWYKKNNFKNPDQLTNYNDIPFLPSSVFKSHHLKSSTKKYKMIESSGTSNNQRSSIYIDTDTSLFQRSGLTKILSSTIGSQRKNFFVADLQPFEDNSDRRLSARFAGISGYLMAAKKIHYLLKLNNKNEIILDKEKINILKKEIINSPIIIIGYTYMLWQYLFNNNDFEELKYKPNIDTKIIHFGGWKKVQNEKVDSKKFIEKIKKKININENSILDIYGFSEQLGSIYVSSGYGGNVINSYSNILIRDFDTLEVLEDGKVGFMQFLSVFPLSYPGFSILNDDVGYISKREIIDGIECLEFKTLKRIENMEPRGCGDTLPDNYYV